MSTFHQACDLLDAAVFTGNALWNNTDNRRLLRHHLGRWSRALEDAEVADLPEGTKVSYYFTFERGQRVKPEGKPAALFPGSGLAAIGGLTREQRDELDKIIGDYVNAIRP